MSAETELRIQRQKILGVEREIGHIIHELRGHPPHRSIGLAITKLEEACHWLKDRREEP